MEGPDGSPREAARAELRPIRKFTGQKLYIFKGPAENYGEMVGRESIDEAIRDHRGVDYGRKTAQKP